MNEYHGGIHEKEKENPTEKNIEIKTFRCFFFVMLFLSTALMRLPYSLVMNESERFLCTRDLQTELETKKIYLAFDLQLIEILHYCTFFFCIH